MQKNEEYDFKKLYVNWLHDRIDQNRINENTYRISMPFLDVNNDHIELYIIDEGKGRFTLTDDGYTISNLRFDGVDLNDNSRRNMVLESILDSFGISRQDDELLVECTLDDLPNKKHMLAQCMMKVSDIFYMSRSNRKSLFLDDVTNYLTSNGIRYVENICVVGKSKLNTHYDFVIPHSRTSTERFIITANRMDSTKARSLIFSWTDTVNARKSKNSSLYVFFNDDGKKISNDAINALSNYEIKPALWTHRNEYLQELAS